MTAQEFLAAHSAWIADKSKPKPEGRNADLYEADLYEADLSGASLSGASLRGADLSWASLRWASLRGASLRGADLRGADLSAADLSGANLSAADLSGADLRGAKNIQLFGHAPTSGRMVYAVWYGTHWMVQAGCFWGTLDELKKAVDESHQSPWYYAVISFLQNFKP